MKTSLKFLSIFLCLSVIVLSMSACHNMPKPGSAATEAPVTVPEEPAGDEDTEMLINNSDSSGEEELLISNPERSSILPYAKTAGKFFLKPASMQSAGEELAQNAQIVRPTQQDDSSIEIRNDHNITYPENPPLVTKSLPDDNKLKPLGYIPPYSLADGQSIQFGAGETSAVIQGYVQAGGTVTYNLYAFMNQNFLVLLTSDSGTSVLSVRDVYGNVFLDANQRQTSHNMYLPRTATYYVGIHSTGYAENFTLQIFIPARVTIPTGQYAAVMSGSIGAYGVVGYTAYMYQGQTARIDDYSGAKPTSFLRVSGLQTGIVYMDYTAYSPSWYAVVPATQDYLIEVISIDQPSNYRLTVYVRLCFRDCKSPDLKS